MIRASTFRFPIPLPVEIDGLVDGIGAIDDPAITDPDDDASSNSSLKGIKQLLLDQLDLLAADGTYRVISANGTSNAIVNGPGTLLAAVVTKKGATANTLDLYDGLTSGGTSLGQIDTTDRVGTILYGPRGLRFGTGLTAVMATGTAGSVTLIYRAD